MVFGSARGSALAQATPTPPANGEAFVYKSDYERWLRAVQEAAEQLAQETGTTINPEAAENFDAEAKKTLKEQGVLIRPNPPTGLMVQ